MADSENDVGSIALAAFEVTAAEMTVGLRVSNRGLDGGSAAEFAFDHTEDPALLAGDEDAPWGGRSLKPVILTKPFREPCNTLVDCRGRAESDVAFESRQYRRRLPRHRRAVSEAFP